MRAELIGDAVAPAPYESHAMRAMIDRLAHHIRGPLAGISGALHILREREGRGADEQLIIDEILDRLGQLTGSMEALVDLARPLAPRLRRTSLVEILRTACTRVEGDGVGRFELDAEADIEIEVDGELMSRALQHILANAAEAGKGQAVRLRARLAGPCCELEVTDCGKGWSGDDLRHMFEPFVTSKGQHLGIGLAVARRIVRAHGGDLSCERADADGTVMMLRLPAAATP